MNPQDLHNNLAAALARGDDADTAMDAFHAAMEQLAGQATPTLDARTEAMSLGVAVKGSLLRAWTDTGALAFADYGRHLETMERLGLAKSGRDFQDAPVTMLTTKGLQQAALLQGFARALHEGIPWAEHVPHAAPSARDAEQNNLWGEKRLQGLAPTGERVWSNGHVALVWPDDDRHMPASLRDAARPPPVVNLDRSWPQNIDQRQVVEPVAVSGTLNSAKASVTDARQVWFSNGSAANAGYVDAILRAHPDAEFHADPRQARRGSIAVTVPHKDGHKVVGMFMPLSSGYLDNAMPEGVGRAMDAYWQAKGVDPRTKALERSMEEQMQRFSSVNGFFNAALRSGGRNIVLRGHWNEEPTPHPVLQWDVLTNQQLHAIGKHTQVLALGFATPQHVEQCKHMDPKALAERWQRETTLAEIGRDGTSMAMTDGLGRKTSLDSIEKVEKYKRERALPEWLGAEALHELRYKHEAQDSQAFTPVREREGPPVAIGTRVRWTANPPNMGCVEGLLTECDRSQAGHWRLTIATRRFDGEPMHHRLWSNEGSVEEAGWSINRDHRFTRLMEPNGDHRLVESIHDLEDLVHGIGLMEPSMAHYADELRTQFWQTRTLDEYTHGIEDALQDRYGLTVDEALFNEGLAQQRDMGVSPLAMAHLVGTRLDLTPVAIAPMVGEPMGMVMADGLHHGQQHGVLERIGQKAPQAPAWNTGPGYP